LTENSKRGRGPRKEDGGRDLSLRIHSFPDGRLRLFLKKKDGDQRGRVKRDKQMPGGGKRLRKTFGPVQRGVGKRRNEGFLGKKGREKQQPTG